VNGTTAQERQITTRVQYYVYQKVSSVLYCRYPSTVLYDIAGLPERTLFRSPRF